MSEFLNTKEAAELLRVTPHQVARLCLDNKIKGAVKRNGCWQIPQFTPVQKIKRFSMVGDICLEKFKRCPIDFSNSLYDRICKYGKKEGYLDFSIAAKSLIRIALDQHDNRKKMRRNIRVHSSLDKLPIELQDTLGLMITDNKWPEDFPYDTNSVIPRYKDMARYAKFKGYEISKSAVARLAQRKYRNNKNSLH
jgi:hypothetical protein